MCKVNKSKQFVAFISFWVILPVWATTFALRPMEDLVYDAQQIVRGKVLRVQSEWGQGVDGNKKLFTYVDIEVTDSVKGMAGAESGKVIRVREVGGEKDGVALRVPGAAHFEKGEETVLFLGSRTGDGAYEIRGLGTGKYEIMQNEKGEEFLSGGMLSLVQSDTDPEKSTEPWTWSRLKKTVKEQRVKPPVRDIKAPLRTVTLHAEANTPLAPSLQSQSTDSPGAGSPEEGRSRRSAAWKWGLCALLGALGYALMKKRQS